LISLGQFTLFPLAHRFGLANDNQKRTLVVGVGVLGREICEELEWSRLTCRIQTSAVSSETDIGYIDLSRYADSIILLSRLDEGLLAKSIDALSCSRPRSISALVTYPYGCEGAKRRTISDENLAALKGLTPHIQIVHSDASQYGYLAGSSGNIALSDIQGVDKQKLKAELIDRIS
jgi:photosystem II stability/assembly factor-like uncharacterized protein